jgi:RNA polymerase sigma-70 factor (ECF subfamily)
MNASNSGSANRHWFATTHWSVVLAARDGADLQAAEALEKLCRSYWYPIYAYVRRAGHGAEEAQDLTQAQYTKRSGVELIRAFHLLSESVRPSNRF